MTGTPLQITSRKLGIRQDLYLLDLPRGKPRFERRRIQGIVGGRTV